MLLEFCQTILEEDLPDILKNYIQIQEQLDVEQMQLLRNLFEKMDQFELESINVLWNGLIVDGLVVLPNKEKKKTNLISEECKQRILNEIGHQMGQDSSNLQNVYYTKSFIALIQKLNYLTNKEQFLFNCLFEVMKMEGKKLETIKPEERTYVIH